MRLLDRALRAGERKTERALTARAARASARRDELEERSDAELLAQADELRAQKSPSPEEALAICAVAAHRAVGLRAYPEQLIGALALCEGRVAEMKTGEGKTLVAALALFWASLAGRGAHLITVNDYLARRDAEWMGPAFELLGASVGVVQNTSTPEERRAAYAADITYVSNSELGFDYLRDNLARSLSDRVLRSTHSRHFAVVDEADSVMIDEARVPLVISGQAEAGDPKLLQKLARAVRQMEGYEHLPDAPKLTPQRRIEITESYDYEFDRKWKTTAPTERGVRKLEEALEISHLYTSDHGDWVAAAIAALDAQALYERDRDYAVIGGEVKIIDEFTGRALEGRQWSGGLHQAVEAKEGLSPKPLTLTRATISYQSLLREYETLAGMTGTAIGEATELQAIYGLSVVEVPTHRPVIRQDLPDLVFVSEAGKWRAVVERVSAAREQDQPVLVGTTSVEASEKLSELLRARGIPHQVLNAKPQNAASEAAIIAEAGRPKSVVVATNMAGRGVDIKLGGDPDQLLLAWESALSKRRREALTPDQRDQKLAELRAQCEREGELARAAGGLLVLGTERHPSRRIDAQLRGRSGRQGDPGETQFLISAEDELLKTFGGPRLRSVLEKFNLSGEDSGISGKLIARQIDKAQRTVEEQNFLVRKKLLDYDEVLSSQRNTIWAWRDRILRGEDISAVVSRGLEQMIETRARELTPADGSPLDAQALAPELSTISPQLEQLLLSPEEGAVARDTDELVGMLRAEITELREDERARLGEELFDRVERQTLLHVVDSRWPEHLSQMEALARAVTLRSIAQVNPLVAYRSEGFEMFERTLTEMWETFARYIFHIRIES